MQDNLIKWMNDHKISFHLIDNEVVEIEDFGKVFITDLSNVKSIFRGTKEHLEFNLMEDPSILMNEGIYYVAFRHGYNWYYYDLRTEFKFNIFKYIGKRQACKKNVKYVNLAVHTPFELLNGSGDISDWVKKAKYLGHTALGICDYNTMAATLHLQKECIKQGMKHVFGYSFVLEEEGEKIDMKIYCQSQTGIQNLLRIQKEIMVDNPAHTLSLDSLLSYASGNTLILGKHSSFWMQKNLFLLDELTKAFEYVFYQVDLSEFKADRIDREVLEATKNYFDNFYVSESDSFYIEPILLCDTYYLDREDANNKIILNKIATGAAHNQSEDQYFKDADEHYHQFKVLMDEKKWDVDSLFMQICSNTLKIAENASASFQLGAMHMPQYIMQEEEKVKYGDIRNMFYKLLEKGLYTKIPKEKHPLYRERLQEEIYIIESTNTIDYFLIQWDIVKEAKSRGIATGIGRGSAGGSLVSYLLGIISIDPIQYELMFSRFLVPERCGLNWANEVTIIGDDIRLQPGKKYLKIKLKGEYYLFSYDSDFVINRYGEEIKIKACEIKKGDEIIFDNRDLLWTLKEIKKNATI